MRTASALFALIITSFAYSQAKHLKHETIIKTNILSLFAARPSVSFEKLFREKLSLEVSFVQGEFYNLLYTDHYGYDGILIRLKKYFSEVSPGCPLPYEALYLGNLNRKTQTEGQTSGSNGYIGYPSRDFKGSSVRAGGSLGLMYILKSKIVIDGQTSLGYGKYYRQLDKVDPGKISGGYLDFQAWISVGYSF